MAVAVAGDIAAEHLDELGALRAWPDQAHLAAQHVEQLWQLINRSATQDTTDERAPVLAPLHTAGSGVDGKHPLELERADLGGHRPADWDRGNAHRAELVEIEFGSV